MVPACFPDFYRLENIEEISDLGLDDYLYGKGICVIEWADKGLAVLPDDHLLIKIDYLSDNERNFVIEPKGERYVRLVAQLKGSIPPP
jgi:tRNA threonylcarbamoyladenosine biosynthesis protein TsaE